ncbi:MAG TPA: ATP-binding cassette domain-containing protein [Kiritimatiellia bacterium]|nr:ATP-binding cassette domain-containing protein [Kiritimatiellia bacterium]
MQVELRDIHKLFGTLQANAGISLSLPAGSLFGVLGENGAGKSTLLKILSGFQRADRGEILLDGQPARIRSPADGIRLGIGMLHQDPLDFPPMTCLENFLVGRPGPLIPSLREAAKQLLALAGELEFRVEPGAFVDTLTVGERQQLEILRLLGLGAQLLILDEPTTGISTAQRDELFRALRRLVLRGRSVVLVTHKLADVQQLCSRVAVLRKGQLAGEVDMPCDSGRLVELMFGKALRSPARQSVRGAKPELELDDLGIVSRGQRIDGIQLAVNEGEIIGLAGVEGSGQNELLRTCAGILRSAAGRITIGGRDMTGRSHRHFLQSGVAYLPAARLEAALIRGFTVSAHFALAGEARGMVVDWDGAARTAAKRIADFDISARPESLVEELSGGNQQRLLLSLLDAEARVLLLEQPTRGLDVESAAFIWEKLRERCGRGACLFFASSDLDELLQYSDRILVFSGGRVSAPLDAASASVEDLGRRIGGRNS